MCHRKTCDRCYESVPEKKQLRRRKTIDHYGGKCICCGEVQLEFLHIDHVDTPGCVERAEAKERVIVRDILTARTTGLSRGVPGAVR